MNGLNHIQLRVSDLKELGWDEHKLILWMIEQEEEDARSRKR